MAVRNNKRSNFLSGSIFIAPNCYILGNVELGKDTSIWFGSNIRSDDGVTIIKEGSAVLENCYIEDSIIGKNCVVSHGAIVHKAVIKDSTFIGIGARVLNGVEIGENCLIGAGAVILPGRKIAPNSVVVGNPGRVLRETTVEDLEFIKQSSIRILNNAIRYSKMFSREMRE